jgi:hypothetical protein
MMRPRPVVITAAASWFETRMLRFSPSGPSVAVTVESRRIAFHSFVASSFRDKPITHRKYLTLG